MAINFPIVTTFDERAVKKADKAFTALGKTFIGVFSVAKVVQFSKASVRAFAESQKEAQLLATQLESINLGFASPYLNEFIDKLALATGKTGGELTNAFIALSQATGDATTAQKILSTALDVSMGTGKDLQTVSVALQRAYKGETTALAKLRIGYSTAELKGKDFNDVLADLQNRFEGAAAAAADTFAGKLARLTEAVEQAKEAFGKGFVEGLQSSQIEVEELQTDIINLGTVLGKTAAGSVAFADKMIQQLDRIGKSQAANFVLSLFEKLTNYVVGPIVFGQVGTSFSSADAARQAAANRAAEKSASARLRALNALSKAELKTAAIRLQNEKKVTAEKKKQAQAQSILNNINKRFEMDRIQIAAALKGELNSVERLRLELMGAILDEDVKRAIILEGQLIGAEAAAEELALILDSLDEMVGDPFADWPGTINKIKDLLRTLNIKIPIETLFAERGLRLDQDTMMVTKLERMDVEANNVYINGNIAGSNTFNRPSPSSVLDPLAAELYKKNDPIIIPAVEAHADALLTLAESELELANLLLAESGGPVEITVNVEGNVISEGDLAETLINNIYKNQRNGQGILLSSVSI